MTGFGYGSTDDGFQMQPPYGPAVSCTASLKASRTSSSMATSSTLSRSKRVGGAARAWPGRGASPGCGDDSLPNGMRRSSIFVLVRVLPYVDPRYRLDPVPLRALA